MDNKEKWVFYVLNKAIWLTLAIAVIMVIVGQYDIAWTFLFLAVGEGCVGMVVLLLLKMMGAGSESPFNISFGMVLGVWSISLIAAVMGYQMVSNVLLILAVILLAIRLLIVVGR